MRKIFCDKCGKEITEDVEMVFNHELCPDCAKAVDTFITRSTRPATMDELRDFCNNFSDHCVLCPFYDEGGSSGTQCTLRCFPCNWFSEEEIFLKLLDYKVKHPDWRKKEEK